MKKIILTLAVALLGIAATQAQEVRTMVVKNNDGTVINVPTSTVEDVTFTVIDHEYVDLGLPSGTLWATCNVGANSPEEYGDYFAWGETETKEVYTWETHKWCEGTISTLTKYNSDSDIGIVDNKRELDPEDDAATVNWGTAWRIPSREQCLELISKCDWTYTTMNGVNGFLVSSKSNVNSIFLPAAGLYSWWKNGTLDDVGTHGNYWTRNCYSEAGICLYFNGTTQPDGLSNTYRCQGMTVRPVRVAE